MYLAEVKVALEPHCWHNATIGMFLCPIWALYPQVRKKFLKNKIQWEDGTHSVERIIQAELVVKSPGIPNHAAVIKTIEGAGITIISEIEFASNYTDATIIGITGSNGKTTTAMLTHHLLTEGGVDVGLAGNIGNSFAKALIEDKREVYVLEISSFQLEHIKNSTLK